MTTVYGIKNCDTVKKALKWLDAHNIDYSFHDFRADGLSEAKVKAWLKAVPLETILNKRSTTWRQLDETTKESISDKSAPAVMAKNPTLVKRPVLEHKGKTMAGFSEKEYSSLFGK